MCDDHFRRWTRCSVLLAILPLLVACGGSAREQMGQAVEELESIIAVLEGCGDPESFHKAIPELEEASQRVVELTADAQELPEDEKKAFTEEYGERLSKISRRCLKQTGRLALSRELRSAAGRLLKRLAEVTKRLSPFQR